MILFEDGDQLEPFGHKFGLPELPIQSMDNMKHRYDPVVVQVTNLLMQHGKLSVAQTVRRQFLRSIRAIRVHRADSIEIQNMAMILNYLRTAPPPVVNPSRPLMLGAPPASHLPLNPVLYLTLAIDSVAPLLRIRSQKGAAGGGVALQIPVPLGVRQRRRTAIMWIIDAASKRRWTGSGKGGFAQKVAQELISIVEGKSGLWERRGGIHRLAVSARSNLNSGRRR
jgi:small subunit ribosomal protein S7